MGTGIILPLYTNKGSHDDPNNYRGITLLSCLGKLFTNITNNRLAQYLEDGNILGEEQAGFRAGYSTLDHCHKVIFGRISFLSFVYVVIYTTGDTCIYNTRNLMSPICLRVQMSVNHRGALVTASCFSKQVLAVYFCAKTSIKSSKNAIIATGSEC